MYASLWNHPGSLFGHFERLRRELETRGATRRLPVFVPPMSLSTDNAAMIAAAGLRRFARGELATDRLNAVPSLVLG